MGRTIGYRPEIDGLRAIAVLLVVLYHAGIGPSGGFVGVDIFFVISGYLITLILATEIAEGRFSLSLFYERRIRRILPALMTVLLTSLIVGWFWIVPDDYSVLAHEAASAAFGLSNIFYFLNTGYFDQRSELLPLLHTWSLGVEEQFYVIWPALLLLAWSVWKTLRALLAITLIVSAVSFTFAAIFVWQGASSFAFFMMPTRAWELGMGAALAFLPAARGKWLAELMPLIGLSLIVGASLILDSGSQFPGWNALAPCIGAALIVWPRVHRANLDAVLSIRPLVWVGLVSYSLYLWHWPVIVFARFHSTSIALSWWQSIAVVIVSIVAAAISYWLIERPFRRYQRVSRRTVIGAGALSVATVGSLGVAIVLANGFDSRLTDEARMLAAGRNDVSAFRAECHRLGRVERPIKESCVLGGDQAPRILLWGDSHGVELADALAQQLNTSSLMSVTYSACPPAIGFTSLYRPGCAAHNDAVFDHLAQPGSEVETVILTANYAGYLNRPDASLLADLRGTATALADRGIKVVIVEPFPRFEFPVPAAAARQAFNIPGAPLTMPREPYDALNAAVLDAFRELEKHPGIAIAISSDVFCDTDTCTGAKDGVALFYDEHHPSMAGARRVASAIIQTLR